MPVCVTRCGNFYGGSDLNWNRLVPGTIRALIRGKHPVLRSDGLFVRDYFYVKDGALAYLRLAECMAQQPAIWGEAFNFSTEQPVTVLQMVERISSLMGQTLCPHILATARQEIPHQHLSAAKARRLLDWGPRYDLNSALRETIAWYRQYFAGWSGRNQCPYAA
jgi:CDP-glucose 4,6-dehydratase